MKDSYKEQTSQTVIGLDLHPEPVFFIYTSNASTDKW